MKPRIAQEFESLIAKPRLDSYKGYFHTNSLEESIGMYMWNGELSACFATLISIFEITLRNRVHRAMSLHYSNGNNNGPSASFHWYNRIWGQLKPRNQGQIDNVRYEGPPRRRVLCDPAPSPDEIVSRVSFGFWSTMLGSIDRRVNFADKILPAIFPNHSLNAQPLDWTDNSKRGLALAFIYELNTFRNRIAHHEPIWKFAAVYDGAKLIYPSSINLADSLVRLQRILSLLDDAMHAMSRGLSADLRTSSWRRKIDYLLLDRGVSRYRTYCHCPVEKLVDPQGFQRNFHRVVRANQPVRISKSGSRGLFVPD